MADDDTPILMRLNDGREIPAHTCHCGHCGNEWFVPGYGDEWMPNYCCFCGIRFWRREHGGDEAGYRPAAGPGRPALTLYVWEGVLTDHTDGVMFALARDADEARRLIREAFDYVPGDDLARTPEAVAGPKAFVKWGGG